VGETPTRFVRKQSFLPSEKEKESRSRWKGGEKGTWHKKGNTSGFKGGENPYVNIGRKRSYLRFSPKKEKESRRPASPSHPRPNKEKKKTSSSPTILSWGGRSPREKSCYKELPVKKKKANSARQTRKTRQEPKSTTTTYERGSLLWLGKATIGFGAHEGVD